MSRQQYYIIIRTEPHGGWIQPSGWQWDDYDGAVAGARRADDLWMSVRLMVGDETVARCVPRRKWSLREEG